MNKMLQDYDRITGFGHRVDISELRETAREWPSDVLVDREEIVQKIGRVNALLDEVEQERLPQPRAFPNYDNIVTKQETTVNIRKNLGGNGFVTVLFNGQVISQDLDVSGAGETLNLTLTPGANTLSVIALDYPCNSPGPDTYRIEFANNLYGKDFHLMTVPIGNSRSWTIGLPLITVDGSKHPESARHLHDYLTRNAPNVGDDGIWTLDRDDEDVVERRRDASQSLYRYVEGNDPVRRISEFDLDEAPFAAVEEGAFNAFVRPIPFRDNEGAGSSFGRQINKYGPQNKEIPDNHDVQVQAINIGWSRSRVGTSGNDNLHGVWQRS